MYGIVGIDKPKVFVSYNHKDDRGYKDEIEKRFGHLIVFKSSLDSDLTKDEQSYKQKLLNGASFLRDVQTCMVLIGKNSKDIDYIDYEISAALSRLDGRYCGLIGIFLPGVGYNLDYLPSRLLDNVKSKYAKLYSWCFSSDKFKLENKIEKDIKDIIKNTFNKT